VNKTQLVDALTARFDGNRKAAQQALEAVVDTITREVAKGEKVAITGFGSFEKRVRDARWVRNPRTGDRIKAKKTAVPKFTPGAELKAVVSGAKKLPKLVLPKPPAKRTTAGKTTAARATTSKTAASKTAASGSAAKKTSTRSTATASKTAAAKSTASRSTSSRATKTAAKAPAKKATARKAPARKTATKTTTAKKS
jgi:DNA-binding protein HU-beta